jgi:hypothetical protein
MRFPTRDQSHVTETASFKRLDRCIPDHWIVRHASERDYGIDCLIEPVADPGGPVEGHLLAIQMKGTKEISWRGGTDDTETVYSGTRVETVNYWMGLPLPVFLCVHDQNTDAVFYARVQHQVRRRYHELLKQDTFGFRLSRRVTLDLSSPDREIAFLGAYLQERAYPLFAQALADLLVNRDLYADYIEEHIDRDHFLAVRIEEYVRLTHFYKTVRTIAYFCGLGWAVPSLDGFLEEDRRTFHHDWREIHELTQARILRALTPMFLSSLRSGCEIVDKLEMGYWLEHNTILFDYVSRGNADGWMEPIEKRLEHVRP